MKKSLIALAFGTLGLGIAEFTMMGILPYVARDLNISIPVAGHFISAYALGVCAGAPMLIVARKRPLKHILLVLMALMLVGNLGAAMAPDYWLLLAARFISGLPHGAYFGVASIVAGKLADEGKYPGVPRRRGSPHLYRNLSDLGIDVIKEPLQVPHDPANQQLFEPVREPVGEKIHRPLP